MINEGRRHSSDLPHGGLDSLEEVLYILTSQCHVLIKKVINKGTPVVYVISMKIHETRTCALYSNPEVGEVRDVRKNKLVDLINKEDVLWNNTAACSLLSLDIFSFH